MLKIVLIVGVLLFNLVGVQAHEKEMDSLDNLVKKFEANPADPQNDNSTSERVEKPREAES